MKAGGAERLHATHPNQVWALDVQSDETANGRRLKLLNIVDEHTREALAMQLGRRADAQSGADARQRDQDPPTGRPIAPRPTRRPR